MSRTTVGSDERDALAELEDAEDCLYAAAVALLRINARDRLAEEAGLMAKAAHRIIQQIKERRRRQT